MLFLYIIPIYLYVLYQQNYLIYSEMLEAINIDNNDFEEIASDIGLSVHEKTKLRVIIKSIKKNALNKHVMCSYILHWTFCS